MVKVIFNDKHVNPFDRYNSAIIGASKNGHTEIVKILQDSTVIDWITKDDIQRRMRKKLKLLLIKKKYPKDKVEPVIYRILDLARVRFRR